MARRVNSIRNQIIDAAARAAYVSAWADYQEEQGESLRGELMDQAPSTPAAARKWAVKLISEMEKLNGQKIDKMYARAAAMPHTSSWHKRAEPDDFGHYTAMQALGHGVSWGDDHPEHGFLIPSADFHCWGARSCEGSVHRAELARRG